jgi:hypothetical protein
MPFQYHGIYPSKRFYAALRMSDGCFARNATEGASITTPIAFNSSSEALS